MLQAGAAVAADHHQARAQPLGLAHDLHIGGAFVDRDVKIALVASGERLGAQAQLVDHLRLERRLRDRVALDQPGKQHVAAEQARGDVTDPELRAAGARPLVAHADRQIGRLAEVGGDQDAILDAGSRPGPVSRPHRALHRQEGVQEPLHSRAEMRGAAPPC